VKNGIRTGLFIAAFCLVAGAGYVAASPAFAQDKPALFNKNETSSTAEHLKARQKLAKGKSAPFNVAKTPQKKSDYDFKKKMELISSSVAERSRSYIRANVEASREADFRQSQKMRALADERMAALMKTYAPSSLPSPTQRNTAHPVMTDTSKQQVYTPPKEEPKKKKAPFSFFKAKEE